MTIAEVNARTFTIEEASLLLPRIRSLVGVLVEANAATAAKVKGPRDVRTLATHRGILEGRSS
ncbi:MAG: hypothetical protein JF888_11730 [Candidatus Dormibacteraeota bacterium]|uniref:Uncharacterized protein n=1 Tax=Candidatus Dormiibacter inghamiae TaxID=3127013 RepID=A0A934NCT9_9BACT|nr:hypothetical protein [Candidatus Dormibacteraeota bacterium]MBJ7606312.1 hypothetical protein [Candidatus Dormibacteraeota bacterium]